MNQAYKGNVKMISRLLAAFVFTLLTFHLNAQVKDSTNKNFVSDSTRLTLSDTTKKIVIDTVQFKTSKNELDAPVNYHADDSMVIDVPGKKMLLYGKMSNVKYIDNDLSAPQIEYDQQTNLVTAFLKKDSLGKVIAYPKFVQGDFNSRMDTIRFNMKTQKGITKGTYTQQGEMFVYGEKIKKISDEVFYAFRSRFTTCNLDTPHFAFVSKRIKMVNQKMAYSGMVHPEFEGVPIPIYLPFGIYPLKQGRHSGILAPTFNANQQLGLSLENLGYYRILSNNWDAVIRGTIYSYGSWTADLNPRYYKRYHYRGSFALNLQSIKNNAPGDPDNVKKSFRINWRHDADTKARPGVTFGASVDAGSTRFNEDVPNSPLRNFSNTMQSSINYGKIWKDKPYSVTVAANHYQNSVTRSINLNIPDVNFNLNTIYPFRRREPVGPLKWFENLGIGLNSNVKSLTSFIDTAPNIKEQIKDNFRWGGTHSVPISLSLPPVSIFQIAPTISYQERWYQRKYARVWNPVTQKQDTTFKDGFYAARQMSFGLSVSTRIFGMFGFSKRSKIQAIRHEIRPSFNLSYSPDMQKRNYRQVQVDAAGTTVQYSVFENSIASPFASSKSFRLGFGVDNNLSMKVRNKKDTTNEGLKKISLIDGFSINSGYDFFADSFKLSPFSLNLRTNILEKINLTASASLTPYQTNAEGRLINRYVWKDHFSPGTFQSGNISLQSAFSGGNKKNTSNQPSTLTNLNNINNTGVPLDDVVQEQIYMQNNPGEFADFSIPWSFDFSYSMLLQRILRGAGKGFYTKVDQNVRWNSSLNLTQRWKLGLTGMYNITDAELGTISMYLSREMHCWQMTINISPVGRYRFFTINISPKSGLLRDLKINRTRFFYDL